MADPNAVINVGKQKEISLSPTKEGSGVPSGFVLKLYQMVNGAPDEVISWLPSGEAFRISDLQRLENETLPTFFRHNRFQSLVRQLNFYNFRKVNRERTFWVYRHPLFHRDRPGELYLLRRRTCPGVDGRKNRSDSDVKKNLASVMLKNLPVNASTGSQSTNDNSTTSTIEFEKAMKRKKRQMEKLMKKKPRVSQNSEATDLMKKHQPDKPHLTLPLLQDVTAMHTTDDEKCWNQTSEETLSSFGTGVAEYVDAFATMCSPELNQDKKDVTPPVYSKDLTKSEEETVEICPNLERAVGEYNRDQDIQSNENSSSLTENKAMSSGNQSYQSFLVKNEVNAESDGKVCKPDKTAHSNLVNKVSRQLEAHARRHAAMGAPRARRGRRRAGTVTPPRLFESDTMKYNALTYDDEIASSLHQKQLTHAKIGSDGSVVVTDGDESDDSGIDQSNHNGNSNISLDLKWACHKMTMRNRTPPISDTKLITDVVTKLQKLVAMNAFTSNDDCQLTAAVAGFCMSTCPHDPDIASKALNLMSMCHPLGREFYKYRCALHPISTSTDKPNDLRYPPIIVCQLFETKSDSKESVRCFKAFVFNYLKNLMDMVDDATNFYLLDREAQSLSSSMNTWFYGVLGHQ